MTREIWAGSDSAQQLCHFSRGHLWSWVLPSSHPFMETQLKLAGELVPWFYIYFFNRRESAALIVSLRLLTRLEEGK